MAGFVMTVVKDVATKTGLLKDNFMNTRLTIKELRICFNLLSIFVVFYSSGCATGPLRYKMLGHYKYATTEFPSRVSLPVKPLAITGGLITDGTIVIADTVVIPIVALPLAIKGAVFGPEPDFKNYTNEDVGETLLRLTTFPVYFPWGYVLLCYFQSYAPSEKQYYKMFYPAFYGEESSVFLDKKTTVIKPDVKK